MQSGVFEKVLIYSKLHKKKIKWLLINNIHEKFRDGLAEETHTCHAIREKLRHPGSALDLKAKDLIGHLWVSLIIDQSECLVCFLFLHWINSFLHCFNKKYCTALNQSEWRIFFMYIIYSETRAKLSAWRRQKWGNFHSTRRTETTK